MRGRRGERGVEVTRNWNQAVTAALVKCEKEEEEEEDEEDEEDEEGKEGVAV